MRRKVIGLVFSLIALACLCGCETIDSIFRGTSDGADMPRIDAQWWDGPRVRPGVALIIQVGTVAAPPTEMQVQVDQGGDITLPLLLEEPVACDGLTLDALKQKLVKAYSKYYRQPMVTVTFAPFDGRGVSPWGTVTVLGEVLHPGPVNMPSTMDLTVTKVLQEAGGCKPFANTRAVLVTRCDKDGNQTQTEVNIDEIGKAGRIDKDIPLRSGDVVWVPQTWY